MFLIYRWGGLKFWKTNSGLLPVVCPLLTYSNTAYLFKDFVIGYQATLIINLSQFTVQLTYLQFLSYFRLSF
jgi:hypothetical protein